MINPWLYLLTGLLAYGLTGLIRRYALAKRVLDIPNQRSSHTVPTARGGGLAMVMAFFCAMLFLHATQGLDLGVVAAWSATLLVAVIGFCDDHAHVPARWRFLTHLVAALLVLFFLQGFPWLWLPSPVDALLQRVMLNLGWLGYPLGALLLVWLLNLFNFMDGTDGLAASEAVFVSAGLAGYLYFLDKDLFSIALNLMAAALGFLLWNWPKAKIFMGDVGSGWIGLALGVLILMAAQQAAVLLYCGLILLGIFVVDATYTLLYRVGSGQKWYEAHCSHGYQRAAKRYGHLAVLLASWAINLCWLLPISLLVFKHPHYALAGLGLAYLPLLYLAYRFKAGQHELEMA